MVHVTSYTGWYSQLYYTGQSGFDKYDALVADIHTAPTDAFANPVGWVLHVGTGKVDMMVINAATTDGRAMSYVGPVYRYYEYVSTNFKRLTDEEWRAMGDNPPIARPAYVYLYLADSTGKSPGTASSLLTTNVYENPISQMPMDFILGQNFPNPFNSTTIIPFSLPSLLGHKPVSVKIFNTTGQEIIELLNRVPPGRFVLGSVERNDTKWCSGGKRCIFLYCYNRVEATNREDAAVEIKTRWVVTFGRLLSLCEGNFRRVHGNYFVVITKTPFHSGGGGVI